MPSMDVRNTLPGDEATGRPEASEAPTEAVAVAASGTIQARDLRTLLRVRRKQQQATAEATQQRAPAEAGKPPGLGALNRQLALVMEQLEMAHHHIGQVAAERDALRQLLADLQGVPVEDIVVPSVGASGEDALVSELQVPHSDDAPAEPDSTVLGRLRRLIGSGGSANGDGRPKERNEP